MDREPPGIVRELTRALLHSHSLTTNPTRAQIADARKTGILWLKWSHFADNGGEEARYAQLMLELLALVHQIDYDQWLRWVEALWPHAIHQWRGLLRGAPFRLGVDIHTTKPEGLTAHWTYLAKQHTALDPIVHLRSRLANAVRKDQAAPALTDNAIPVRFTIGGFARNLGAYLLEIHQLSEDRHAAHLQTESRCPYTPRFRVVDINVEMRKAVWITEDLWTVQQLAGFGIPVPPLHLQRLHPRREDARQLASSLQHLLHTNHEPSTEPRAASVEINICGTKQKIESVCSALFFSASVRHVAACKYSVLRGSGQERAWQWLTVAVFRRRRPTPIEKLTLDCHDLEMENVFTIEQTMNAPNALAVLFPRKTSVDAESGEWMVTASRFRLDQPRRWARSSSYEPTTIEFASPVANLVVLPGQVHAEGWVSVLLPGYGQVWVADTDATLTRTTQAHVAVATSPVHLSLNRVHSSQAPVVHALLQCIGKNTRTLSLAETRTRGTTEPVCSAAMMHGIFRACPKLEVLEISELPVASLEDIVAVFEDDCCRVQHLVLENILLVDETNAFQFFDVLADRNHPMTKSLRTLYCSLPTTMDRSPKIIASVHRLLHQNRLLYDFQLVLGSRNRSWRDPPDGAISQADYDCYQGESIVAPLPLNRKWAFLSVVCAGGGNKPQVERAIHSLDTSVLSVIFRFAAEEHARLVRIFV